MPKHLKTAITLGRGIFNAPRYAVRTAGHNTKFLQKVSQYFSKTWSDRKANNLRTRGCPIGLNDWFFTLVRAAESLDSPVRQRHNCHFIFQQHVFQLQRHPDPSSLPASLFIRLFISFIYLCIAGSLSIKQHQTLRGDERNLESWTPTLQNSS